MAERNAIVIVDGLLAELPNGDMLRGDGAIAQVIYQNNAILRLLAANYIALQDASEATPALTDDDIENLIQEITP